jgi:hypothetical protein
VRWRYQRDAASMAVPANKAGAVSFECRMRSDFAVNTGVLTYAHTRLRAHWAPGIPGALFNEGDEISAKL